MTDKIIAVLIIYFYLDIYILSIIDSIIKKKIKNENKSGFYPNYKDVLTKKKSLKIFFIYVVISSIVIVLILLLFFYQDKLLFLIFTRIFSILFSFLFYNDLRKKNLKLYENKITNVETIVLSELFLHFFNIDNENIKTKIDYLIDNQFETLKLFMPIGYKNELRLKLTTKIDNYNKAEPNWAKIKREIEVSKIGTHSDKGGIISLLFQISTIDGKYSKKEDEFIKRLSKQIGINSRWFNYLKDKYVRSEEDFSKDYSYFENYIFSQQNSKLETAYKVLGVNSNSSDEEIKSTYRELVKKHHPDKVAYLGEEYVQKAEKMFRKIQEAYEIIENNKE